MNVCWEVARSSLFQECPRSRSHLTVVRGLANGLTLPPNGRRGQTPLDGRDGLPVVHPVKCMAPDLQIFRESNPSLVYSPGCEAILLCNG